VLPIGGLHLTNDLAIGLRTPQAEAEKLKVRHGTALVAQVPDEETVEVPSVGERPPRIVAKRQMAEIIHSRAEEMLDLVRREIVKTGYEGMLAAGAVIT